MILVLVAAAVAGPWLMPLHEASAAGAPDGSITPGEAPARTTTTTAPPTTAPPTTAAPTTVAPSTAAPTTVPRPATTVPALERRATESEHATTRLNRVVVGLLGLAVVIAVATVFFWFRTRPTSASRRSSGVTVVGSDGTEVSLDEALPIISLPGGATSSGSAATAVSNPEDPWYVAPAPELPRTGQVSVEPPGPEVAGPVQSGDA